MDEGLNYRGRDVVYVGHWLVLIGRRFDPSQDRIIERYVGRVTEHERKISEEIERFRRTPK